MEHHVDRRTIRGERNEALVASLRQRRRAWLEGELELARLFLRVDAKATFLCHGAASMGEFGARLGYDGFRVEELTRLGHALAGLPELEAMLVEDRISFAAACELGRLYRVPECLREDDRWLEWATLWRLRDLRRRVRERLEAHRQGVETAETVSIAVTAQTRADLHRCQEVASGKAKRLLSMGQTLTVLTRCYLKRFDPTWKRPRPRRMAPTLQNLEGRGVAAEVVRAIVERSGGLCEFGLCEKPITQLCHRKPHREGSPREARDLVGGCVDHHKPYDIGWIRPLGWTTDGRPCFQMAATKEILYPKPRPEEWERDAEPEWLLRAVGNSPTKRRKDGKGGRGASAGNGRDGRAADEGDRPPRTASGAGMVRDRGPPYRARALNGRWRGRPAKSRRGCWRVPAGWWGAAVPSRRGAIRSRPAPRGWGGR